MYIDSEIILKRRVTPIVYVYVMIVIIIVLSLIMLLILYHYKTYYISSGVVIEEDNAFYIQSYVPIDDAKYLLDNNELEIDDVYYKYRIKEIDNNYFVSDNKVCQIMNIDINIPADYKYNNLTLSLKVLKEDKRVIDYILKK